jgi:ubiquitin-conjugating enzyme E2 S
VHPRRGTQCWVHPLEPLDDFVSLFDLSRSLKSLLLFFPFFSFNKAELEGPQGTPYESKFFQLKLVLGVDFPQGPPRGFFLTKIYHPNVDMSTGAICVNTLKKDWTASTTFSHVLSVIRCLLIIPFPESSLNDEAGKLFMESYDEYSKRALLMADVHGRPGPCGAENDEKRKKIEDDDKEIEGESSPSSKRKTGYPLGSKNSNNLSSSGKGAGLGEKVPGDRLSKKKSLKRL